MRKLLAGCILIMALPMAVNAQGPGDVQRSPAEAAAPGSNPGDISQSRATGSADEQNEAFNVCLRATQRFEQREATKGSKQPAEASITASCKKELKPLAYWQCMDKESMQDVDFNTAHWRCGKQTNILQ
ncbi:hypothetical protein [Candidatus Methylobacter oryzae]|uniref:Uncharacterized protein n=1 Tax=Candidatus Methylobacter oryzae TaxID=2497749 RepID=A0ABY3CA65_9GAMM|nr:hypothetical protein [Candidatus Methylobacter oryzae]TRW94566.1 hypothetical protein EKO24_011640 [Candidatus Methylobacter oryzae]